MNKLMVALLWVAGVSLVGLTGYAINQKVQADQEGELGVNDQSQNGDSVDAKVDLKKTDATATLKDLDNAAASIDFGADLSDSDLSGF